ncbi:MAG: hypothetical protein KDB26_16210 [Microthrixaceae bacterium]|nr:hypothetical protein [Microthrixaceae bacterium]
MNEKNSRITPLDLETTAHAALRVGKTIDAIRAAISTGRLPAYSVQRGTGERFMHLLRPSDVDKVYPTIPATLPVVDPDELAEGAA